MRFSRTVHAACRPHGPLGAEGGQAGSDGAKVGGTRPAETSILQFKHEGVVAALGHRGGKVRCADVLVLHR